MTGNEKKKMLKSAVNDSRSLKHEKFFLGREKSRSFCKKKEYFDNEYIYMAVI